MQIIHLQEQYLNNTLLTEEYNRQLFPYIEENKSFALSVKREDKEIECLLLSRKNNHVSVTDSYFVGIDWIKEGELAVEVYPKMNKLYEIDYVKMLNDALGEPTNFEHLTDLITIRFDKPSIRISQQQDLLSIFLITEFLNCLKRITRTGLKKSFYLIENNLKGKIKGKLLSTQTINKNLIKGRKTDNICQYQVYGIDTEENRILKKALSFCIRQLEIYKNAFDVSSLTEKVRYIKPYFEEVGNDVETKVIKNYKSNPVFKEYFETVNIAKLLLHRYSYNITQMGLSEIDTPPYWIDMSKLFELYVFQRLRKVFTNEGEVTYHLKAHYQELDYLLKPTYWSNPYVIDAKYKPYYKDRGLLLDDAREVAGYARLSSIYKKLNLDEENCLPIKCLIIYPDQDEKENFTFSQTEEPDFIQINEYIRMYKIGIRLPVINRKV